MVKALRYFKDKHVKDSSVRYWQKNYKKELKERSRCAGVGEEVRVESLPGKKRRWPPILGQKLDKYLQEITVEMRSRGTPIGATIVVARGILLRHNKQMLNKMEAH